jgi:hypothetical protein
MTSRPSSRCRRDHITPLISLTPTPSLRILPHQLHPVHRLPRHLRHPLVLPPSKVNTEQEEGKGTPMLTVPDPAQSTSSRMHRPMLEVLSLRRMGHRRRCRHTGMGVGREADMAVGMAVGRVRQPEIVNSSSSNSCRDSSNSSNSCLALNGTSSPTPAPLQTPARTALVTTPRPTSHDSAQPWPSPLSTTSSYAQPRRGPFSPRSTRRKVIYLPQFREAMDSDRVAYHRWAR